MKHYLKLIWLCSLLGIGVLATAQVTKEDGQPTKENNMLFDIKAFEALKKEYPNQHLIEIDLEGRAKILLSDDKERYWETTEKYNGRYKHGRVYFKPSGQLMQDTMRFYDIYTGTTKLYNESGELTRSIYYTPDDWADRLVASVKKDFNFDLSQVGYFNVEITQNANKTKKAVVLTHLNGQPVRLVEGYDPVRYFMLLDFDTFKLITDGGVVYTKISENVPVENPNEPKTLAYPRTESTYFINGKPESEFKW